MLVVTLAAALVAAAPIKLGSPGLKAVHLEPEVAEFFSEHLAQALALEGLRVLTSAEIAAVIGLEKQRQLTGCAQDSRSCLLELSGALGADALVTGSVGKFGDAYQVNVQIVSSKDGLSLSVFSARASSDKDVLDALTRAARTMAPEVTAKLRGATAATSAPGASRRQSLALIPAGVGVAGAVVGAVLVAVSSNWHRSLVSGNPAPSLAQAEQYRDQGAVVQGAGLVLFGVAAVGLGVGARMYFSGAPPDRVALRPWAAPGAGGVLVSGRFR